MITESEWLSWLALIQRMRVLQIQRDELPGASAALRQRVREAEAEVDLSIAGYYLPPIPALPAEGGAL